MGKAGDGSGGDSIYNGKFNDEKPGLKVRPDSDWFFLHHTGVHEFVADIALN